MSERISKPAPPHNPLLAPAMCGCVECSRKVLDLRCLIVDSEGRRCGDYRHHRGEHTLLIATDFVVAEERVRLDGPL